MEFKIALAQIKTSTGDLEGNTNRIISVIKKSIESHVEIVVFPELSITGYNCGMLFNEQHFIDYQTEFLNKYIIPIVPENLIVILGVVDSIGKRYDGSPEIQNSAFVIQGGKLIGKYAKILLANGGHHDDRHYFTPGSIPTPVKAIINNKSINLGVVICEDIFSTDHRRNICKEICNNGAEILISLNQSFFTYGKLETRQNLCIFHAKENHVPFIYVNNVGIGDITKNMMLYDGGSLVADPAHGIVHQSKRFNEDFSIVELSKFSRTIEEIHYSKYEEIFNAIVFAQREIFKDLGFQKAIVAVSGGLDSSVLLPLMTEAMGNNNVIALSMPSNFNGDVTKTNAQQLCDALGVKLHWLPIQNIQDEFIKAHQKAFEKFPSNLNISTFDAVGRTVAAIAASQHFKAGLVSTSNHTEIVLNWFSWHDVSTAAVYGPLADLTKVEIFAMAEYINQRYGRIIIPENLYNGETMPGPELADAMNASWDYYVVSGICAMLIRLRKDVQQIVDAYKTDMLPADFFPKNHKGENIYRLVPTVGEFEKIVKMCFERQKASVYKTAQAAPPLMMSPYSRGFSNREPIFNFYAGEYNLNSIQQKDKKYSYGYKLVMKLNHHIDSDVVQFFCSEKNEGNALKQFDDAVNELINEILDEKSANT